MNDSTLFLQTLSAFLSRAGRLRSALCLAALLALGLSSPAAHAQSYAKQTLHSFTGGTDDGSSPQTSLILVNGKLYGTTAAGGGHPSQNPNQSYTGAGTIFAFDPATNTETTLYKFTGTGGDGANPNAGLLNINGTLYGTTEYGGIRNLGIVFSYNPATNTETILYKFTGTNGDGANPQGSLINVGGKLYGTCSEGGSGGGYGMIYAINPSGTGYQNLYSFTGPPGNGQFPVASLLDLNGVLLSTTEAGGGADYGCIFSFDPATSAFQELHFFPGIGEDGDEPRSGLLNVNGLLYGTTSGINASGNTYEPGSIYSVNPDGSGFQTLHVFGQDATDGAYPFTDLILDNGLLYGTTTQGGSANLGTLFSYDPAANTEKVLASFLGQAKGDGDSPQGSLIDINGTLYGTTFAGGTANEGTIFSFTLIVPPTAKNDTYTPKYQTAYVVSTAKGVLANDNNGGYLSDTATLISKTAHGSLTFHADGSFTYTPSAGYLGTDSFTYKNTNEAGTSNTATVTLNVYATVPLARNDVYAPKYATAYVVSAAKGVLANDTNYDTGAMTATLVTNPSHGTLTFHTDGSFTYTPAAGFIGADSFTYYATNPIGRSSTATATLNVYAAAPVAKNDSYAPKFNLAYAVKAPGVLGNDYTGGSTTTSVLVTNPSHGTVTLNSDGSFTYTPNTGYLGSDSFTYKDTNSIGTSSTATVSLTVQKSTPVAHSDSATFKHNTTLTVAAPGVLANDYTGGSTPLTAAIGTQPTHGTVTLSSNGGYVYTPNAGYIGTDTFTYQVSNPVGKGTNAPVTLNIQ